MRRQLLSVVVAGAFLGWGGVAEAGELSERPAKPLVNMSANLVHETRDSHTKPGCFFPPLYEAAFSGTRSSPLARPLVRGQGGGYLPAASEVSASERLRASFEREYKLYCLLARGGCPSYSSHSDDYDIEKVGRRILAMGQGILPLLRERAESDADGAVARSLIGRVKGQSAFFRLTEK